MHQEVAEPARQLAHYSKTWARAAPTYGTGGLSHEEAFSSIWILPPDARQRRSCMRGRYLRDVLLLFRSTIRATIRVPEIPSDRRTCSSFTRVPDSGVIDGEGPEAGTKPSQDCRWGRVPQATNTSDLQRSANQNNESLVNFFPQSNRIHPRTTVY